MRISCATFLFQGMPLEDALKRVRDLGFSFAELSINYDQKWGHLHTSDVLDDLSGAIKRCQLAVADSGVKLSSINVNFHSTAVNVRGQFESVCDLARATDVSVVSTVSNQASERLEVNRLKDFISVAATRTRVLSLETFSPSLCSNPEEAVHFMKSVPGLKVTLDTGHLLASGHVKESWLPLFPHLALVHLKDSGPDYEHYQVPVGSGLLDTGFVLDNLATAGYEGDLVVEYPGPRAFRQGAMDYERETVRLRELLEKELASRGTPR